VSFSFLKEPSIISFAVLGISFHEQVWPCSFFLPRKPSFFLLRMMEAPLFFSRFLDDAKVPLYPYPENIPRLSFFLCGDSPLALLNDRFSPF